jgi:hypothetical protein
VFEIGNVWFFLQFYLAFFYKKLEFWCNQKIEKIKKKLSVCFCKLLRVNKMAFYKKKEVFNVNVCQLSFYIGTFGIP